MDKHAMGHEADSLAAGAAWLQILLNNPEKKIIKLIQKNQELVSQKISLTCLGQLNVNDKPECKCSRYLETLQGCDGQTTEDVLEEFHSSLLLGVCPHVMSILQNYDGTQLPSEATDKLAAKDSLYGMVTRLYKKHKHSAEVDMNQYLTESSERSVQSCMLKSLIPYSCTASITVIHVATALGKHKLLREILSDRVTPFGSLCFHFESDYHSVSPFHVAVLHRQYKAIDILRKKFPRMACNMDRHFGRGNITPSTLAAHMNDANALQHLLKYKTSGGGLNSRALLVSLENRSMECAEFLIKRNHARLDSSVLCRDVPCIFDLHKSDRTLKLLKDLLVKPAERDFLKLLVDNACFPINTIVFFCIYCDAVDALKYLLESTKAVSLTRSPKYMCLLNMATFKNSPRLLSILVKYVGWKHLPLYTQCSPLYWARVMQYDECVHILEKSSLKQKEQTDSTSIPPFLALLMEARASHYDLTGPVMRLKEVGCDINATNVGVSCLNFATDQRSASVSVKRNGTLVSLLLELGADVFATKMYNVHGQVMQLPMLLRLLSANVDVGGPQSARTSIAEDENSIPPIIMQIVTFPMQLLLLRTAHTICKDNIDFLRSKLREYDRNSKTHKELFDHLSEYVDNVQPLLRICRNSVRRATGIHLNKFLENQTLPKRLVDMLMLKDDLEPYWQSCKENRFWSTGYGV